VRQDRITEAELDAQLRGLRGELAARVQRARTARSGARDLKTLLAKVFAKPYDFLMSLSDAFTGFRACKERRSSVVLHPPPKQPRAKLASEE
jgi:hypothetical protein